MENDKIYLGDAIVTTCLMAIFSQCFGIDWQEKTGKKGIIKGNAIWAKS